MGGLRSRNSVKRRQRWRLTKRLYREYPEDSTFWGRIVSVTREPDGRVALELEQTLFFPQSGGQPCDVGTLNDVEVVGVVEDGETIVHHLAPDPATEKWAKGRELSGAVDLARRQDNTTQHSGQHLLSAVLLGSLGLQTVAFQLGDASSVDVASPQLTQEQVAQVEAEVNAAIRACHPVKVSVHRGSAVTPISMRTQPTPEELESPLGVRIIQIGSDEAVLDRDPCCGTHVTSTGQLGTLVILDVESVAGDTTRLTFAVGRHATSALRKRLNGTDSQPVEVQADPEPGADEADLWSVAWTHVGRMLSGLSQFHPR